MKLVLHFTLQLLLAARVELIFAWSNRLHAADVVPAAVASTAEAARTRIPGRHLHRPPPARTTAQSQPQRWASSSSLFALSESFLENDLVAIRPPSSETPRLCVVRPDGGVEALCTREDDVETDLFVDPRVSAAAASEKGGQACWTDREVVSDGDVVGAKTYGEGWYGQRPVPSLGGGPGYGADADEVWSVEESVLDDLRADGVDVPVLDVGIAHGEKARGGALF